MVRSLHRGLRLSLLVLWLGGGIPGGAAETPATPFSEADFAFPSGDLRLHGTVTLPAGSGPHPAVVIIAGSGPTDRNGDSLLGPKPRSYALLAEGLAARGIASLRYDKRGLPTTEGTVDPAALTVDIVAGDAVAAVRALAARPEIGPVFLLGHSEGGTLALLAARSEAPLRGVILVATIGRRFGAVLREQLAATFSAEIMAEFDVAYRRLVTTDEEVTPPALLAAFFQPANRNFLRSWEAVDPVALVAATSLPVLVLQGETDVQVKPEDARLLAGARPGIALALLPGVNHVLKEATGPTAFAQLRQYHDPSLPLAPSVVPAIADWVVGQLAAGSPAQNKVP